jgi:hypothetical protein
MQCQAPATASENANLLLRGSLAASHFMRALDIPSDPALDRITGKLLHAPIEFIPLSSKPTSLALRQASWKSNSLNPRRCVIPPGCMSSY